QTEIEIGSSRWRLKALTLTIVTRPGHGDGLETVWSRTAGGRVVASGSSYFDAAGGAKWTARLPGRDITGSAADDGESATGTTASGKSFTTTTTKETRPDGGTVRVSKSVRQDGATR